MKLQILRMYYGMQVTLVCEGHHIGVFTARQILLTLWEKSWFIYSSIHCSDRFKSQSSPPLETSPRPGPGLLRNLWYFTESFFARGGQRKCQTERKRNSLVHVLKRSPWNRCWRLWEAGAGWRHQRQLKGSARGWRITADSAGICCCFAGVFQFVCLFVFNDHIKIRLLGPQARRAEKLPWQETHKRRTIPKEKSTFPL